jgi:hypothetical protein
MSVPENARTKGKLEACVKAHDLACYTLQITTNKKNFPEQFQAALTDKIVSAALDIHTLAWSANNVLVNSPEDLAERLGFQERAAVACNILLSMIEVAHRVFHLPTKRVVYWSGKAIETRNLIRAWRESDRKRYSDKFKK